MRSLRTRSMVALVGLAVFAAACGSDTGSDGENMASESMGSESDGAMAADDSSTICDADGLVAAVQGGAEAGTLEGMADDPVATAASNNPVLTTLVTAVGAAGLGDTLNGAEALTVFAPTDCAFAALDSATLTAALDDPSGLLTTVLGYHVIAGQRLSAADLAGMTELDTFTGEKLAIEANGDDLKVGGQANVLVGDIQTANATVFLIDAVMIPPSVSGGDAMASEGDAMAADVPSSEICDAAGLVEAVQGGSNSEGTLEGMADDPVATAASNNPVLTTLVTAVGAAGLGDTLNGAEALTVFAPTDCAFAALDGATLQAALDDPQGLLTTVLGFHVIAGQRLSADDLAAADSFETFTGETLTIEGDKGSLTVGGQASVQVEDIQTANATVFLIDTVMIPPSVSGR